MWSGEGPRVQRHKRPEIEAWNGPQVHIQSRENPHDSVS